MIPVLLALGAVLGRWWRTTLVVAAAGWPAVLVATGVMDLEPDLLAASTLAVTNAGVGIVVHHGVARVWRSLQRTAGPA
jgi:hypothetical protein